MMQSPTANDMWHAIEIVINKQFIISTMKSQGFIVRGFRDKYIILYIITLFFCMLIAMTGVMNFTNIFENYQYYQQLLNTAFGGVLGLVTVITMFYLGKFHDYKKGFLQTQSQMDILYESYSKKTKRLMFLRKILEQYTIQAPQFLERIATEQTKLLESNREKLEHVKGLRAKSQNVTSAVENIFAYSKPMGVCVLILSVLVAVWIMGNLWFEQTDGALYYQAGMLMSVVASMLMFWKQYEQYMGTFHNLYHDLLKNLSQYQSHLSDVEESILDFKEMINVVETKYIHI